MELKIELDKNEIAELTKMSFIAQFVISSSGVSGHGDRYRHMEIFTSALRELDNAILPLIPERGLLEMDNDRPMHTPKMEEEMMPVLKAFMQDTFLEQICTTVSRREYTEEYGMVEDITMMTADSLYAIIYNNNWKELEKNGLKNFRLYH